MLGCLACLRELFLAFSGAATHARSEARSPSGAAPAAMKGARARNARCPVEKRRWGDTAAKDALVAVAALSLAPLFTHNTSAPAHRFVRGSAATRDPGLI